MDSIGSQITSWGPSQQNAAPTPTQAAPQPRLSNAPTGPTGSATVASLTQGIASSARGPQPCQPTGKAKQTHNADGSYSVECDQFGRSTRQQQDELWCWAACIQMICAYHGQTVTQGEVVQRVHNTALGDDVGNKATRGALQWEVLVALCPDDAAGLKNVPAQNVMAGLDKLALGKKGPGVKGNTADAIALGKDYFVVDLTELIESLSHGTPAMISLNHRSDNGAHMYVIYGAEYTPQLGVDASGAANLGTRQNSTTAQPITTTYSVSKLIAVDPWTGERTIIEKSDFDGRIGYEMTELSAKRIIKELSGTVQVH